jgi:hypothetical protein
MKLRGLGARFRDSDRHHDRGKQSMPYVSELSRAKPSCFLFLIDQSSSMAESFGAQPEKPKAEGVADGINRLLQNLALKCAKADGVRDFFHVGVIGYGGPVAWALGGQLAGQKLIPISVIANFPLRADQRTRQIDDGAGGLVEQRFKFPVWFEPVAGGRTPMCQAITEATEALRPSSRSSPTPSRRWSSTSATVGPPTAIGRPAAPAGDFGRCRARPFLRNRCVCPGPHRLLERSDERPRTACSAVGVLVAAKLSSCKIIKIVAERVSGPRFRNGVSGTLLAVLPLPHRAAPTPRTR